MSKAHVLIIPSEEFVPSTNHTSGIFQYHQAVVLQRAGHKVGALSVRQEFSVPMILRAAMWRGVGRLVGNALDQKSVPVMARLLYEKLVMPGNFARQEMAGTIPIVRMDGFYYLKPSPTTNQIGWVRGGMEAFRTYVRLHGKPDVVHAHNLDAAGLLAWRIKHEAGIPYVVTEHSTYYHRRLVPRELYPRLAKAAREAATFAAVSPSLSVLLQQELGLSSSEIKVLPNVIDPELEGLPVVEPKSNQRFRFLCLGNLIPVKNHALLIRAFSDAFQNSSNVTLRIGGEGELRGETESLIDALGMKGRIELLGRLDRKEVIRTIDDSDALVLPSRYETFGVVLIEALARGRPVITTASGGPENFVTEADGEIVPDNDRSALAAAMTRMVAGAKNYDVKELSARAFERFGTQALVAQLAPIYEGAVS